VEWKTRYCFVEFRVEGGFERVGDRGVGGVEIAEVRTVDWFNRVKNRWQKGKVFGVVLEDDA
jgi:hypothetical protein